MQKYILFLFLFLSSELFSQPVQDENYRFFVDLNNADYNQLEVELITPVINSEKAEYKFPAMVPGTYKVYNFGRFVSNLKAFDASGNELPVENKDINTWEISGADKMYKITYRVRETFGDTSGESVFEPVGTCIEKDSVFVFNNHGFFGYLNGYLENDYIISFKKPEGFYGSTSLDPVSRDDKEEIFTAEDYQYLVDNPVMFNVPDTVHINFDEIKVLVSVYSPGKGLKASDLSDKLRELLIAIRNYLGGKLPADKYSFLYFFTDKEGSGSFGALEHNISSFYYMPDVPKEASSYMINQLQSTSAHEFYHIVTPLNLHSEEIGNFDFNDPKMSRHLWLYEGVTEYHSNYIRLREGLIDMNEFAEDLENKMNGASKYNDTLPFTEMSKGALDKYENQYFNVYQKGALIGLCLDILIRKESNGSQGIQDVINVLTEKYGMKNPFKDDELFDEIVSLTSPEIGEFIRRYVDGPERIPYNEILGIIGLSVESTPFNVINMGGGISMGFNQENHRLVIQNIDNYDNKFIKDLGIKNGDELISINGTPLNFMNIRSAFGSLKNQFKEGDKVEIVVARYDDNGKEENVSLNAVVSETKISYENKVKELENISDLQKKIKNAWLGK